MGNHMAASVNGATQNVQTLKTEVEYRTKLQEIGNKLNSATNLDEIFLDLQDEVTSLFEAERMTVYVVDGVKRELVSRLKSGNEIAEIRIPVSKNSIAGYAAFKQSAVNIQNAYDNEEISAIDPDLQFDSSWDQKTGFSTKQIIAHPIIFQKYLLGALQLVNHRKDQPFTSIDEKYLSELSKIFGIALYNQKRIAKGKNSKFDYLLENHLITQKELNKAIADARKGKRSIPDVLIKDLKIPKGEIGKSLSRFYKAPFIEYNPRIPIPGELLSGLKVPFMRNNLFVPIRMEEEKVLVTVDNPNDLQKVDQIKVLFPGKPVTFCVSLEEDILEFIKLFTQDDKQMAEIDDILSQLQDEAEEIEEAESAVGEEDSAVVQVVNKIILDAYSRGASDIHIEPYPGKQNTEVRIRIDGACTLYQTIPFS